ncbi:MAG: DUF4329 domain-containing protein [Erythrobacter sp.]|uniref:DUF4329 domain-containing protein n=1 Tax=Erythrobacter sp. TaxID=1042 RepID=UPI003C7447F9
MTAKAHPAPLNATRIIFALCAIAWVAIVWRGVSNVKGPEALVATVSQAEVQRFARQQLESLQPRSFAEDLELCGIVFETSEGELGASRPSSGNAASCDLSYFDEPGMVPVASFHTHGRHSRQYDGEVPSLVDIQSDIASGLDGYVSTPGGRLWHIDHERREAHMVCGAGCLTQDPRYEPCVGDRIEEAYTLATLRNRFSGGAAIC